MSALMLDHVNLLLELSTVSVHRSTALVQPLVPDGSSHATRAPAPSDRRTCEASHKSQAVQRKAKQVRIFSEARSIVGRRVSVVPSDILTKRHKRAKVKDAGSKKAGTKHCAGHPATLHSSGCEQRKTSKKIVQEIFCRHCL